MKKYVTLSVMTAIALGLTVLEYFLLPQFMTIRLSADGMNSETVNKIFVIGAVFVMTVVGNLLCTFGDAENRVKYIIVSALGYFAASFGIIINLIRILG